LVDTGGSGAHQLARHEFKLDANAFRVGDIEDAGLVRKNMMPKPLYEWLFDASHKRWTTNAMVTTDANGDSAAYCFFGDHIVHARLSSGATLTGGFTLARHGTRELPVTLR
jgi:hypothetical protein